MIETLLNYWKTFVTSFGEEKGVTVIEYTLLAVLLILGIVATVVIVGGQLSSVWAAIQSTFASALT